MTHTESHRLVMIPPSYNRVINFFKFLFLDFHCLSFLQLQPNRPDQKALSLYYLLSKININ